MRATGIALVLAAMAGGCLKDTSFHCATNDQCGTGGQCELSVGGFCSFADADCGRRFGPQAGSYANQCVGGGGGSDSGVHIDTPMMGDSNDSNMMIDSGPPCPSDFVALAGAPAQRRYKLITAGADWPTQKAACTNAGAPHTYLAYPDTMAELQAMDALAGGVNTYWIGIDDLIAAGTWKNSNGGTQTYLPWQGGNPSSNPNDQCVEALSQTTTILNDRCTTSFPAMCACE
jgi:hypothetical protein